MIYLIILAILSLGGAGFMLWRRIDEMAPHVEEAGRYAHSNFIFDFFRIARKRITAFIRGVYSQFRPHFHQFISYIVSRLYRLSSWFAEELLNFYNFIQGRKVLKNSGKTSIFIRDITGDKYKPQT